MLLKVTPKIQVSSTINYQLLVTPQYQRSTTINYYQLLSTPIWELGRALARLPCRSAVQIGVLQQGKELRLQHPCNEPSHLAMARAAKGGANGCQWLHDGG